MIFRGSDCTFRERHGVPAVRLDVIEGLGIVAISVRYQASVCYFRVIQTAQCKTLVYTHTATVRGH